MDNKLCVNPSTRSTLVMEGELPILMVPEPIILPFLSPPNLTSPPDLSTRSWNIDLLPVMCREHPESRYHDMLCFVLLAAKDISSESDSDVDSDPSSSVAISAQLACSSSESSSDSSQVAIRPFFL